MAYLDIDGSAIDKLITAMEEYSGNVEEAINYVLHNEVFELAEPSIKNLMPVSGKHWKGKKAGAKASKSLSQEDGNLSVTVRSKAGYAYLYFPDDGSNTRRHIGNQRFFERGGEAVLNEITNRCINKLTNEFEKGV